MLQAITADLPAYLVPPTTEAEARQTATGQSKFGPAAQVDLSATQAITGQSQNPGSGLYGPDGQFVEGSARRELPQKAEGQSSARQQVEGRSAAARVEAEAGARPLQERPPTPKALAEGSRGVDSPPLAAAEVLSADVTAASRERDLALAEFDAIIPPAGADELAALADHVARGLNSRNPEANELEKIAELMTRVGRHDKARQAISMAQDLETTGQADHKDESTPVLDGGDDDEA